MKLQLSIFACLSLTLVLALGASSPGASHKDVLVEIDGAQFTAADVQQGNPGATFQARNALFDAERKAVDEFITAQLLKREAQKMNMTVDQLLAKYAYASLPKDPSEEALRTYYDGIDTAEPFEAVRDKIKDVIRERRMAKAKTAYVQSLRERAVVKVKLQPPRAPIGIGDAPVQGPRTAAVSLIEYADYECPYCQQVQPVIDKILKDYKGKITFAFKDVPLPNHANAQKASEAAHCAGSQGKFWEYHNRLFITKQFAPLSLKDHARALGLDQAQFDKCLDSGAEAPRIRAYVTEAQAIGLPGTPGFFVNGRLLNGAVDYDVLRRAIDEELQAASSDRETAQNRARE